MVTPFVMIADHGHINARKDSIKARCGGPAFCIDCRAQLLLAQNCVISADSELVSFIPLADVKHTGWLLMDYKRKRGAIVVNGLLQIYPDKQAAFDHRDRVLPWAIVHLVR